MPFAQPITVERREPDASLPDAIALAPFSAASAQDFLPFTPDDPALKWMRPQARETFSGPGLDRITDEYNKDSRSLAWGVHYNQTIIGVAALTAAGGDVMAELHLGARYRNWRLGEMAAAGLLRAAFTPGLLRAQNARFTGSKPQPDIIWSVGAEVHRQNGPSVRLLKRMGFTYTAGRRIPDEPGRPLHRYELYRGLLAGARVRPVWHRGTRAAHAVLSRYYVKSEGAVPIADFPDAMLEEI